MKHFKPSISMIIAAQAVFMAMAREQVIRPIVEGYQRKILAEKEWPINPKYVEREGKFVTDIKHTYLMSGEEFSKYHRRCIEERIAAQLRVDHDDKCPLLVASARLMEAKFELASAMESVSKITESSLRGASPEIYDSYFELTLKLLAPYVKTKKPDFFK
jgi:hypothetical protein